MSDSLPPSVQPGPLPHDEPTVAINPAAAPGGEGRTQATAFSREPGPEGPVTPSARVGTEAPPEEERPLVPGYQILGELGRGAMGVVYKARQVGLNRLVALKMVLHSAHAGPEELVRFLAEGEAVAHLQHTNIVQIYQVGKHNSLPYFCLEYVEGGSLARKLAGTPQPPREAARVVELLARAMQFAHQRGIVHRDLKPSNVLLARKADPARAADDTLDERAEPEPDPGLPLSAFEPKITDFGLAKRLEGGVGLTQTGAIMGTPGYMAPEQAEGKREIGPAADVYGLGAVLYELLTGRPPFRAPTPVDTILHLLSEEPVPPSRLHPGLSRDLETVCLKCLQKEPHRRYASAEDLADDLHRFLTDRPIRARRVRSAERLWRWCRRNPVIAGMAASVALLLFLLAVGASVAAVWLHASRDTALYHLNRAETAEGNLRGQLDVVKQARDDKTRQLWHSLLDRARAGRYSRQVGQRFDSLAALAEAAAIRPDGRLRDQAIASLALPDLRPGQSWEGWPDGTVALVFDPDYRRYARADKAGSITIRSFPDHREVARIPAVGKGFDWMVFSPDGRCLAARYRDGVRLWRAEDGRPLTGKVYSASELSFRPDGRRLALAEPGGWVRLVDLPSGREAGRWRAGTVPVVLYYAPEGRRLAVCPSGHPSVIRIHDAESGALVTELSLGTVKVCSNLAWHPGGDRLAFGTPDPDHRVYVLDVATRRTVAVMEGHGQDVVHAAFHPGGGLLWTGSWDGSQRLWDAATGRQLLVRVGRVEPGFSRDGGILGYTRDGSRVQLMEVGDAPEYRTFVSRLGAGQGDYRHAAISPDGRVLLVGMDDGFRLWDLDAGREAHHQPWGRVYWVAFRPEGHEFLTVGSAGLWHWPLRPDPGAPNRWRLGPPRKVPLPFVPHRAALRPDGRTLAVVSDGVGDIAVADLERDAVKSFPTRHPQASAIAMSPDGRWLATSGWHAPTVQVWDTRSSKLTKELPIGEGTGVVFAPDGDTMITSHGDRYRFWRTGTWQVCRPPLRWDVLSYPGPVAFAADGRRMALVLSAGVISLLDSSSHETLARLDDPHHDRPGWLGFTPDGTRLVTLAGYARTIHVWDLGAIRRQLAPMKLDWESSPPPSPPPPRPPLTIYTDLGRANTFPAPVIALPPPRQQRPATPERIGEYVRQLGDTDPDRAAAAVKALEEVGPPALDALAQAGRAGPEKLRDTARKLRTQIDLRAALGTRPVRLRLEGATVAEALKALSDQGGIPLKLASSVRPENASRLVTFDLDGVPFWKALDRLSEEGRLTWATRANVPGFELLPLNGVPHRYTAYAGPCRLRISNLTHNRGLVLTAPTDRRNNQFVIDLGIAVLPRVPLTGVAPPRLTRAEDEAGRSLLPETPSRGLLGLLRPDYPLVQSFKPVRVSLRPPVPGSTTLKRLEGVLPVEVAVNHDPVVVVDDVPTAAGKNFLGEGTTTLKVERFRHDGASPTFEVRLRNFGGPYDDARYRWELLDEKGRPFLPGTVTTRAAADGLGVTVGFRPPAGVGRPATLTLYRYERVRTELPFQFRDVPLP